DRHHRHRDGDGELRPRRSHQPQAADRQQEGGPRLPQTSARGGTRRAARRLLCQRVNPTPHIPSHESEVQTMSTSSPRRRTFLAGSVAVAAAGAAAGCSFEKGGASADTGAGGEKAEINVNSFGPRPTFVENFNPFSPTDGVVGSNLFYDPLAYLDVNNEYAITPWLAESIEFDPEARTATVTLRDDITWSDGEKITTDDLVYTVMELPKQAEEQKANVTAYEFEVSAVDERVAEVTWS